MSNLLPRTSFLASEETAALFTNEETANARSKVVEWLNEASLADKADKVELLSKVQELTVNAEAEFLEEFIDNVLTFAQDPLADVKRAVLGFIEAAAKKHPQFLPKIAPILALLLRDHSPQVQKRVTQVFAAVYRSALQWICADAETTDSMEQAWNVLGNVKAQIVDMIDSENDGIRTNAIKFLEGVVILQTYPDEDSVKRDNDFSLEDVPMTLKIARRRKLEDEAINIFELLLKFQAASHISSVNLIGCTGSLCTIAKLRPSLMNPVVEAIGKLNSNLPPTLTDSQISSVRKHLKMQLMNILKLPSSYEMQSTIVQILGDLGCSNQEIARALPKVDKHEQQRRAKRALESSMASAAKRARHEERQMEVDVEEIAQQKAKCAKINEASVLEAIKSAETVVQLVVATLVALPAECPQHFLDNYAPIMSMTHGQQMQKIAAGLAEQMTEKRVGPGASAITKEPPMRPKVSLEEERSIVQGLRAKEPLVVEQAAPAEAPEVAREDESQQRKDEATKKLREHLERTKGEQNLLPKMKQRVRTLKLQEVTKPLSKPVKEQFLLEAVKRILMAERAALTGGAANHRRKILTVLASTFTPSVREAILQFIFEDIREQLDLAFSWIYEEYSLLQGFTRHSYIKSEHKPDYAYNKLLCDLIQHVAYHAEIRDKGWKVEVIRALYLETPLITDECIDILITLCEMEYYTEAAIALAKDLAVERPTKTDKFLKVLLRFVLHETAEIRSKAIEAVITIYAVHKMMVTQIEEFAQLWLSHLEKETPPDDIFHLQYGRPEPMLVWSDDLARICLNLFLALMPYHEQLIHNLCAVYTATSSDMKRIILRSIEVPIRHIGPDSFELLNLVENCPKGAETLITRIIYILTEKSPPTPELVARVRELYHTRVSDVRLLIPVMSGLTKSEILTSLPRFIKLNPVVVKEVFNRLLGLMADFVHAPLPVSPTELLVALHTIDPAKVELKFIVKATSLCLAEKETYTQETLAIVLQQLVEMAPLPTLLMRTVIQSLTLYPRLAGFVTNILQRLILKQVWRQKVVWDGFLKCCQRLVPQSLPVLLQLPPNQLQDALTQCPDFRAPLLDHVKSITEIGAVSQQILDVLAGNVEKESDKTKADEAERRDEPRPMETDQPLPPGED
ncbi:symplekin [Phlebotomus argentipes]|uniref:symplekin n=1 Tax=Phlebotomus argentipes TaxID=94469 RepID=UPI0028934C79|nr:symplekin [Phlebotomus argentipes]